MDAPAGESHGEERRPPWLRRVAWLVGLWVGSVVALGVVAYGLRAVMGWVGLKG